MVPYADQLWHWFGRGQLVLIYLNSYPTDDSYIRGYADAWLKVAW